MAKSKLQKAFSPKGPKPSKASVKTKPIAFQGSATLSGGGQAFPDGAQPVTKPSKCPMPGAGLGGLNSGGASKAAPVAKLKKTAPKKGTVKKYPA